MDNQRIFVWAALALVLWLNYQAWQRDYAPPPLPAAAMQSAEPGAATTPASQDMLPDLPATPADAASDVEASSSNAATAVRAPEAPIITVTTDVLSIDISTRGGDLIRADLLKYPLVKNQPDVPVRLFNPTDPLYIARSGLRVADQRLEPTHQAIYQSASNEYRLFAGESKLVVPLTWSDGQGLTVTKTYTFHPGSYRIDLSYDVVNTAQEPWRAASYVQLVRHYQHVERSYFRVETYAYRGPAIYDGKGYRKLKVEDEEDRAYKNSFAGGWMAALQHHFVAAAVPPAGMNYDYQLSLDSDNDYILGYRGPLVSVPAGGTHRFQETLFVGPKLQSQLEATGPRLELVADYGKLTILSQPLFWLLEKVHSLVRNWGWSIVIVTFLIKLVFYKLTAASGRSMAKMRNVAPRIKAIQERYKDDREQLGRQMMELYKREKINPLAGCLPIVIQIPFFLAFYWVLLESVEMRQAPFLGWITDLSARDPFFILPLLMGTAMFAQFKLQPMPSADPMQTKIFMFMPIIMAVTMAWFPAGLVLYWLTNTLLSIAQQWRINKLVEAESKKT
ncbi:YidC/Oxa1 family membrane protein insertase [Steroidobacter denitrificans]|uniref:Membrane protein insertase YidC n=1 Tax=Steroidobacter denitrificans TaxID=465721 RepID=A0A127FDP4_STEDE|nr:membrane protein insertase YidC [Steroidobacter denitrificans]AMN48482.1 YidC/Oxa1 family membrane protein insertase [Steroidobacter denitrificans]